MKIKSSKTKHTSNQGLSIFFIATRDHQQQLGGTTILIQPQNSSLSNGRNSGMQTTRR